MHYNFERTHKILHMKPVMIAALVDTPWDAEDTVALMQEIEAEAAIKTRDPNMPRKNNSK